MYSVFQHSLCQDNDFLQRQQPPLQAAAGRVPILRLRDELQGRFQGRTALVQLIQLTLQDAHPAQTSSQHQPVQEARVLRVQLGLELVRRFLQLVSRWSGWVLGEGLLGWFG